MTEILLNGLRGVFAQRHVEAAGYIVPGHAATLFLNLEASSASGMTQRVDRVIRVLAVSNTRAIFTSTKCLKGHLLALGQDHNL